MAGKREKVKEKVEDEDMKKWAIQINALEDMSLNDWEKEFIEGLTYWCIGRGYRLTEKQSDTLEKIYRKHF